MAVTAEIAEEVAAAKATAAAKRRPGGGRRAPAAAAAAAAAGQKSPVVALYDRLKDLFRDHYGVIVGLRGAAQSDDADDDAAETAAVANAWAPIERRLQELALAGCAANTAVLRWSSPDTSEAPAIAARLLADVAKTRVVTAFGDGTFEFAHRSVQEYFASSAILALGLASALRSPKAAVVKKPAPVDDSDSDDSDDDDSDDDDSDVIDDAVPQAGPSPPGPEQLVSKALLARGNDSLRRFVAAGLAAQDDIDALVDLLWFNGVKSAESATDRHQQKEQIRKTILGAACCPKPLASLAECIRECRPAFLRKVSCAETHIARQADFVWEAVRAPGASAVTFSLGGSRAISTEFWIVVDAFLGGDKSRQPAIAAIDAYLASVAAESNTPTATARSTPPRASDGLVCRATVSIGVLRAVGDHTALAMAALRRVRDETRAAGSLRLAAIISLSVLDSGTGGDESNALLDLATGSPSPAAGGGTATSTPLDVRCGAIVELGLRHADDAAVRDGLLELLLPRSAATTDGGSDDDAPPPPFDIVRSVVRSLGVPAIPPDSLTEVLLHPEVPLPWARAVAYAAFEFWLSTQHDICSAAESAEQMHERDRSGGVKMALTVDESWNLWHLCASLGQVAVVEELSAREAERVGGGPSDGDPAAGHSAATRTGMLVLHCALATRQWDLVRLLLLSPSEAEGAGYPGIGRLNQRAAVLRATDKGQLPLAYALHLEAPDDISLALIDATPAGLLVSSATPMGNRGDGQQVSSGDAVAAKKDSMLVLAVANKKTSLSVIERLLALYPPATIAASTESGTLLEIAFKRGVPASVISALIESARSDWQDQLSKNADRAAQVARIAALYCSSHRSLQEVLGLLPPGTMQAPSIVKSAAGGSIRKPPATRRNTLREVVSKWDKRPVPLVCAVVETLASVQPAFLDAVDGHAEPRLSTPLFAAAAMRAPIELVSTLLRLGASAEVQNTKSETPLHAALYYDAPPDATLALLRAFPGAAFVESNSRRTPLHCLAASYGRSSKPKVSSDAARLDVLDQVIAAGPAAACVIDIEGSVPLSLAIEHRAPIDVVALLLAAVPHATLRAQLRQTRLLENERVEGNPRLKTLLEDAVAVAAKSGDYEGSSAFAGTGPLEEVLLRGGSIDEVRAVITVHPMPTEPPPAPPSSEPLKVRSNRARDAAFVRRLAEPLFVAVRWGSPAAVVEAVVRANPAATRATDVTGRSPLILAVEGGADTDVIRAILAADPGAASVTDRSDLPPLYLALRKKSPLPIIEALAVAAPHVIEAALPSPLRSTVLAAAATELECTEDILSVLERATPGFCDAEEGGTAELESILKREGSIEEIQRSLALRPLPASRRDQPPPPPNLYADDDWQEVWKKGFKLRQCGLLHVALKHRACAAVVSAIVQALPASVSITDRRRFSALHVALHAGAGVEVIRILHNAEPRMLQYSDPNDLTPLLLALKIRSPPPVVAEVMAAETTYDYSAAFAQAVKFGATDEVILAMEQCVPGYCNAEEGGSAELRSILARSGTVEDVRASLTAHPLPKVRPPPPGISLDAAASRAREAGLRRCHAELLFDAVQRGASNAIVSEILRVAPKAPTLTDRRGRSVHHIAVLRGAEADVEVVKTLVAAASEALRESESDMSSLLAAVRANAPVAVIEVIARATPTDISNVFLAETSLPVEVSEVLERCRPEYCSPDEAGTVELIALLERPQGCIAEDVQACIAARPLPQQRAGGASNASERLRKIALWKAQSQLMFFAISKSAAPDVVTMIVKALSWESRKMLDSRGRSALHAALESSAGRGMIQAILNGDSKMACVCDKRDVTPLMAAVKLKAPLLVIQALATAAPSGGAEVLVEALRLGTTADVLAVLEQCIPGYCSAEEGGTEELHGILARGGTLEDVRASLTAHPLPKVRRAAPTDDLQKNDDDSDAGPGVRQEGLIRCHADILIAAVRSRASAAVVSELIHASPKAATSQGSRSRTALMVAIECGPAADVEVISALISAGALTSVDSRSYVDAQAADPPFVAAVRARVPLAGVLAIVAADPDRAMRQLTRGKIDLGTLDAPRELLNALDHAGRDACGSAEAGTAELEALLRRGGTVAEVTACLAEHPLPSRRAPTAEEVGLATEDAAAARLSLFTERQEEVLLIAVRQKASAAVVSAVMTALPRAVRGVDHSGRSVLSIAVEAGAGFDVVRALASAAPDTVTLKDSSGGIPLLYALRCRAPLAVCAVLIEFTNLPKLMEVVGGSRGAKKLVEFAKRSGAADDVIAEVERLAAAGAALVKGEAGNDTGTPSTDSMCDASEAGTAELEVVLRRGGTLEEVRACLDAPPTGARKTGAWAESADSSTPRRRLVRRIAEPLLIALRQGASATIVAAVAEAAPAALRATDSLGRTHLHVAAEVGSGADVVQVLGSACPSAARTADGVGASPLLVAVKRKAPLPVIEALVGIWPGVVVNDDSHYNPLFAAVKMGSPLEVISLLAHAAPNYCGLAPLRLALDTGTAPEVIAALAAAATPSTLKSQGHRKSVLSQALQRGAPLAGIQALLAAVPALALDASNSGAVPLHDAIAAGCPLDTIRALVAAAPRAIAAVCDGRTPLDVALDEKPPRLDVISTLLAAMPEVRTLPVLVRAGAPVADIASFLADHPTAALGRDARSGRAALHYAASHGATLEVVDALIAAAPSTARIVDNDGCTPLHLSLVRKGTPAVPVVLSLLRAAPDCILWSGGSSGDSALRLIIKLCPQNGGVFLFEPFLVDPILKDAAAAAALVVRPPAGGAEADARGNDGGDSSGASDDDEGHRRVAAEFCSSSRGPRMPEVAWGPDGQGRLSLIRLLRLFVGDAEASPVVISALLDADPTSWEKHSSSLLRGAIRGRGQAAADVVRVLLAQPGADDALRVLEEGMSPLLIALKEKRPPDLTLAVLAAAPDMAAVAATTGNKATPLLAAIEYHHPLEVVAALNAAAPAAVGARDSDGQGAVQYTVKYHARPEVVAVIHDAVALAVQWTQQRAE